MQTATSILSPIIDADGFPKRITIELTSCCNLSCIMCPRKFMSNGKGFMSQDLFWKIVNQLKGREIEAIVPFFRGEPLLHPNFLEMAEQLRRSTSAKLQLATNALLLNQKTSKRLLALGIDFISFSLDATSKKTYEKIRADGDFDLAMKNIHTFLQERSKTPSVSTRVQVSATEIEENREELPAFIEYWKDRVDRVRIYPCHSEDGRFGKLNPINQRRSKTQRKACKKPFTDFVIYYNGNTALCNHDWNREDISTLGSIKEKTIDQIWQDRPYRDIRQKHLDHKWDTVVPCNDCDHWLAMDEAESPIGRIIT